MLNDLRLRYELWLKLAVLNLTVFIVIALSVWMWRFLEGFKPVDPEDTELVEVEIRPGMSALRIGEMLEEKGLIRSRAAFLWIVRLKGMEGKLQSGRYLLSRSMSPARIAEKIAKGEVKLVKFRVPEGLTVEEIARLWQERGFGGAEEFMRAARDERLLRKYGIPADTAEGYLFPETYMIPEDITAEQMVEMMLKQFRRRVGDDIIEKGRKLGLSLHQVVTLASIVEEEAMIDEERPIISAVFHNRLRLGWRLEADPTVRYALGNPKRPLTWKDLKVDSPYNTYLHPGLPPGPICNPGLKSIEAAVNPADVDYLYFVSTGRGRHIFSKTYSEHLRAIAKIKGRGRS